VTRLDAHHLWTENSVRERFDWSKPSGLHAIVVRVFRLAAPLLLPITPEMGGCKSWINVLADFDSYVATPVLTEAEFQERRSALSL
jgi:hypothetical protein